MGISETAAHMKRAARVLGELRMVLAESDEATRAALVGELRTLCAGKAATGRRYGEGVVAAIRGLLAERPGMTLTEIADALDGRFETVSGKPRRLVNGSLSTMLRRGYVARDDEGRYTLSQGNG